MYVYVYVYVCVSPLLSLARTSAARCASRGRSLFYDYYYYYYYYYYSYYYHYYYDIITTIISYESIITAILLISYYCRPPARTSVARCASRGPPWPTRRRRWPRSGCRCRYCGHRD